MNWYSIQPPRLLIKIESDFTINLLLTITTKMLTYAKIVADIYNYYGTSFLNELEDTTIRDYDDFVEKVIEEYFNTMTYGEEFERSYDYRNVNMPATIQMMNYILDEFPEDYTVMKKGTPAVISLFAYLLIKNDIHTEMNYEAEFKEHWRRVDNTITEVQPCDKCGMDEPHAMWVTAENREWVFCEDCMVLHDKYYETGNAPLSVWVNLPIPLRGDTDDEDSEDDEASLHGEDECIINIQCRTCGFVLPEMSWREHQDPANPKNKCLCNIIVG